MSENIKYKNLADVEAVAELDEQDNILIERGGAYRKASSLLVAKAAGDGATVEVDTTLSQEGMAADAKAVGEMFTLLELDETPGSNKVYTTGADGLPAWEDKLAYEEVIAAIIPEVTVTTTSDNEYVTLEGTGYIITGGEYTITVDGEQYDTVGGPFGCWTTDCPVTIYSHDGIFETEVMTAGTYTISMQGYGAKMNRITPDKTGIAAATIVFPESELSFTGFLDETAGETLEGLLQAAEAGQNIGVQINTNNYWGNNGLFLTSRYRGMFVIGSGVYGLEFAQSIASVESYASEEIRAWLLPGSLLDAPCNAVLYIQYQDSLAYAIAPEAPSSDYEGQALGVVDGEWGYLEIPTVPSSLPNPNALTINGTTYDGSEAVTVTIEAADGNSITIDSTLSTSGAAADAAAVGQMRDNLQSDITAFASVAAAAVKTVNGVAPDSRGDVAITIPEGSDGEDGVGIDSIGWSESTADGGKNELTIELTNGDSYVYYVRNGSKGSQGDTPVKGTDYWTEDDQQSIIDAVLAALPAAEEVSY